MLSNQTRWRPQVLIENLLITTFNGAANESVVSHPRSKHFFLSAKYPTCSSVIGGHVRASSSIGEPDIEFRFPCPTPLEPASYFSLPAGLPFELTPLWFHFHSPPNPPPATTDRERQANTDGNSRFSLLGGGWKAAPRGKAPPVCSLEISWFFEEGFVRRQSSFHAPRQGQRNLAQ